MSYDGENNFLVMFYLSEVFKRYWEKGLTDGGYNSWWHMQCVQHATFNPKLGKIVITPESGEWILFIAVWYEYF